MPKARRRRDIEELERRTLRKGAALSSSRRLAHREHEVEPDDFRTEYQRDYTRIIHSRAFRRLRHKTQVFISPRNDHLCTRLEHSLHVASVASTIARAMGLNEDLVQAIAVGHDLGHAPFGHAGERVLGSLAGRYGLAFAHELHSLRIVDHLDSPYEEHVGLNLTFAVRDGIACHHGEGFERELRPDRSKTPDALRGMRRGEAAPTTLEGCVVRWADKVAYLGRDLEDAIELKLVDRDDVPAAVKERLGTSNREIIASLVRELVGNSSPDGLTVSAEVHEALNELYQFNMKRIYRSTEALQSLGQVKRAMSAMFEVLKGMIAKAQRRGNLLSLHAAEGRQRPPWTLEVLQDFLARDVRTWQAVPSAQLAIDFVAGMTDSFFQHAFNDLFFPQAVV
jgi:dGTPase